MKYYIQKILYTYIGVFSIILSQSVFGQTQNACNNGIPCNTNLKKINGDNNSVYAMNAFYSNQSCGLNFVKASQKVTTRYNSPPGSGLPTSLSISGMPACFQVIKAYVWIIASTSGTPMLSITNPLGS